MQHNFSPKVALDFLEKNWIKVFFISLLLFVFFKKDFSFQLNLRAPKQEQTPFDGTVSPAVSAKSKKETLTQNLQQASSNLDKFDFSSIGNETGLSPSMQEFVGVDEKVVEAYLKRFVKVAKNEQQKFGVPASIVLANALLHSTAGKREVTRRGNNHFSLECTTDWKGPSGEHQGSCFRYYENAWTSFRDHSFYVTTGKFSKLVKLSSTDYRGWAKGLESGRFSDESNLAENLIQIIEVYRLNEL